ncbi:phage integrase N-terminal SAM-like domain-containing protein [Polaromonas sp. DSR2-3-2]
MKPRSPPLQSIRLLDQVRERIGCLHCSLATEKVYLYWLRFFVRWRDRHGTMKHPRKMGAPQVKAYLT